MRENLGLIIGGIVALILQVALAPNVAILGAQPNFILVFIVAASLSTAATRSRCSPSCSGSRPMR